MGNHELLDRREPDHAKKETIKEALTETHRSQKCFTERLKLDSAHCLNPWA